MSAALDKYALEHANIQFSFAVSSALNFQMDNSESHP